MKKLLLLLLGFFLVKGYDRGSHKLDVMVERFQFGDYYFVFYSKGANWIEAYTICQATNARLAVVNTPERAQFLAEALSQTKVGFEDVWIGGHFVKNSWQWVPTGKSFSQNNNSFPPWLNYPTQRGKKCLSLDRKNHWDPIFVELQCSLYRPFICEESVSHSIDRFPEQGNEIKINGSQYLLYHGRVTWQEALAFCKQSEARLAIIPDLNTASQLAELMKRSRPRNITCKIVALESSPVALAGSQSQGYFLAPNFKLVINAFESVWIGARKEFAGWTWTATEKPLPNETQRDGFPPWRFDHPIDPMKICLMLDHHPCLDRYHIHTLRQHRCEEAVFIEEQCGLKRDFLCEIIGDEAEMETKSDLATVDQVTYIFSKQPRPWVEAMVTCEEMNMTLAMPETDRQWEAIIMHMADMQNELDHIWLGGRWVPNEWVWLNNHSIPLPNVNSKYPPWCMSPAMALHEEEEDCLNLDRDVHNVALIYGYRCSVPQPFVCEFEGEDFLKKSVSLNEYQVQQNGLTHFQAEIACRKNNSDLATLNTAWLAQDVALLLPRDSVTWIGGRRIDTIWRWLKTREIIPDTEDKNNYPPWDSTQSAIGGAVCLAIKKEFQERPRFVERSCNDKLPYVCEFAHKELPQPDLILNLNGIKYYFYKKLVPWNEAMSLCNSGGLHLISLGNLALANSLLQGMRDIAPMWTAGKQLSQGSWLWVTTGAKLPNEIKVGYQPWLNTTLNTTVEQNMESACLSLDNQHEFPFFEGKNCAENQSFVCVDSIPKQKDMEIEMNNLTISLQDIITSIANAKKTCLENGKSIVDFKKLNNKDLIKLLNEEKIRSLWVDVIHDDKGKWVYTDTHEEFQTEIDFPEKDTLPITDSRNCLTLELTAEQKLLLKPALCSDFSRIICMTKEETKQVPPRVVHVVNETITLTAILENTLLSYSSLACSDLGGEIINGPLLSTAVDFFKTLPPEYMNFWLGAHSENSAWRWNDNTPVQLNDLPEAPTSTPTKSVNQQPTGKECLSYNRESDKVEIADCSGKYSTVCQQVSAMCEPKKLENSLEWYPKTCISEPSKAGAVCHVQCPPNMNLIGPELHVCSQGKWSYNQQLKCQDNTKQGDNIFKLFTHFHDVSAQSYFLLLLDTGIKKKEFTKLLQFARHLGNSILLNKNRRLSLELYSFNSKIIDLMENSNCYFIHTVDRLMEAPQLSNSKANYMGAFLTAERELFAERDADESTTTTATTIIFFFAMRKDSGSMNRTAVVNRLKQKGVIFVVISVGDDINRSQLEEIASTKFDGLQLYTFPTLKAMLDASNFLKRHSQVRLQDCPREYGGGKYG